VLEFHLPYYALRPDRPDLRDSRGLRKHRYFRPPGEEKQDCIYESQLSLIVFGVDDFFWTAYFCEDTYFSNQDLVANCLQDEVDGPSLGRRMHKFPIWDPRYYFLSILATRTGQITLEWTVLVQSLESVLDRHVRHLPFLSASMYRKSCDKLTSRTGGNRPGKSEYVSRERSNFEEN
jgi:hypothetical protein